MRNTMPIQSKNKLTYNGKKKLVPFTFIHIQDFLFSHQLNRKTNYKDSLVTTPNYSASQFKPPTEIHLQTLSIIKFFHKTNLLWMSQNILLKLPQHRNQKTFLLSSLYPKSASAKATAQKFGSPLLITYLSHTQKEQWHQSMESLLDKVLAKEVKPFQNLFVV